jgi:hypothetical protein
MTMARALVKEPAPILVVEPMATSIRSGPRTSSSSSESPSGEGQTFVDVTLLTIGPFLLQRAWCARSCSA